MATHDMKHWSGSFGGDASGTTAESHITVDWGIFSGTAVDGDGNEYERNASQVYASGTTLAAAIKAGVNALRNV
jgi:hypothetical protein